MSRPRVPDTIENIPLTTRGDVFQASLCPPPDYGITYKIAQETPLPMHDSRHNSVGIYRCGAPMSRVNFRVLLWIGNGEVNHLVIEELSIRVDLPKWVDTHGKLMAYMFYRTGLVNLPTGAEDEILDLLPTSD